MKRIDDFKTLENLLSQGLSLLLAKTDGCSVCRAVAPMVEKLALAYHVPAYEIDSLAMPLARGTYQLFAAPIVMIFYQGKEMARQGPFVNVAALERVLEGITSMESST